MSLDFGSLWAQIWENLSCQIFLLIFILFSVIFTFILWNRDANCIRRDIEKKGGKLISQGIETNLKSLSLRRMITIYKVKYIDANGIEHQATCKTGLTSGLYWANDIVIEKKDISNK